MATRRGPISIKVEGTEEAMKGIALTELRLRGRMRLATKKTLLKGHTKMRKTLSRPGTGIVYGRHQASAPGEPPAVDLGQYRASWHWRQDMGMGGDLYTQQQRAEALEYGRKDRTMSPRPHAGPVSEYMRGEYAKQGKEALTHRSAYHKNRVRH